MAILILDERNLEAKAIDSHQDHYILIKNFNSAGIKNLYRSNKRASTNTKQNLKELQEEIYILHLSR